MDTHSKDLKASPSKYRRKGKDIKVKLIAQFLSVSIGALLAHKYPFTSVDLEMVS